MDNVLENIRFSEKLEFLSFFTKRDEWAEREEGASLNLKVLISSFNGLKILPNLKAININEIELLPIKNI